MSTVVGGDNNLIVRLPKSSPNNFIDRNTTFGSVAIFSVPQKKRSLCYPIVEPGALAMHHMGYSVR
jgi:hypothetical protein